MAFPSEEVENLLNALVNEPWSLISNDTTLQNIYLEYRQDFIFHFQKFIENNLLNINSIHKIYNNLYLIEDYSDDFLKNLIEEIVVKEFINGDKNILIQLSIKNRELNSNFYFFGFIKKLIQELLYDTKFLFDSILEISAAAEVDKLHIIFNAFKILKKDQFYKINTIYNYLDNKDKCELLSIAVEHDYDITNNLSYYLTQDTDFYNYALENLTDNCLLLDNLIKRPTYDINSLTHIKKLICIKSEQIPETIDLILEKCVAKRYPTFLLDLSPYINKRKIYKSLLKIDDQHFINKFIKLYKNEDDVKSLLLFS